MDHHSAIFRSAPAIDVLKGNLPHWRQKGATYAVTFRTTDSIPHNRLSQWQLERETWLAQHKPPHTESDLRDYAERFPARMHEWRDGGFGACLLRRDDLREVVEDTLRHFDGIRYTLSGYVVAPNHVHVVVAPMPGYALSAILRNWKSFSAMKINRILGVRGPFWQKESYDHIVRDVEDLERILAYIDAHRRWV